MAEVTVPLWQGLVDGIINGIIKPFGQPAVLQTRRILPPSAGSVDSRLLFETFAEIDKVAFDTKAGQTTFNNVGVERSKSVDAFLEYIPNVTSELYLLFTNSNTRYEILNVEDIGLINGVIKLELELMGSATKPAAES